MRNLLGILAVAALLAAALPARAQSLDVPTMACTDSSQHVASTAFAKNCSVPSSRKVAGMSLSADITAAQLTAALPAFSATAQGLVPPPGSGASNVVLGNTGWVSQTGGGNVSTDGAGTLNSQLVRSINGAMAMSLQQRASLTLSPLEFGAQGNGSTNAIGTTYGSNLLAVCGYTVPNTTTQPFKYLCSDPQMGLNFSLPVSADQGNAGNTLTFISPITNGGVVGWQGRLSLFDDPSYQYAVMTPGMVVSGSGIASNTTLTAVPQIPTRTQRLLPGVNDWAPNTPVAQGGQMVFNYGLWQASNSGTTGGGATYVAGNGGANVLASNVSVSPCTFGNAGTNNGFHPGGNDPGVWVPSYAGTTCNGVDGSVNWTLLGPFGYQPLTLGTVVLSQNTSNAVAAGTNISFAVGSSTVQGLFQDTLGWLGALSNAAHASAGGCSGVDIDMRAGDYAVNYPLMNEANYGNIHCTTPSLSIGARGPQTARLTAYFDPGAGRCVLSESTVTSNSPLTGTRYHDFDISGTVVTNTSPSWGVDGANTGRGMGLCVGESASIDHMEVQGFHAGVGLLDDHQTFNNDNIHDNEVGVYFRPFTPIMGNQSFRDSGLAGNSVASIGIAATDQCDACTFDNIHTGFGAYGIYAYPEPPNVTATGSGLLSNSTLNNVWMEDLFTWIDAGNRGVGKDAFMGGGYMDYGRADKQISNYQGGSSPVLGGILAGDFSNVTLIGTDWGNFGVLSTASNSNVLGVINLTANGANGTCGQNKLDDPALITGGTASQLALACHNGGGTSGGPDSNTFNTPIGSGVFKFSDNNSGNVPAGYPVWEWGQYALLYQDGQPFGGIMAAPQPTTNNWAVPVYLQSNFIYPVPKGAINVDIPNGGPVFPTSTMGSGAIATAGIAGSIDQDGAIGVSINDCGAGQTVCGISLNPVSSGGNGSYASGLTASGQTLSAKINTFTVVPSGAAVTLPVNVPIGTRGCFRINNYGANTLTIAPPSGWTLSNGASAATKISVGLGAVHCRNGATSYD